MHSAKQAVVLVIASLLLATITAACAVKQRTADGQMSQDIYAWPHKPVSSKPEAAQ